MDRSQEILFGSMPRSVGVTTPEEEGQELLQYPSLIHSQNELDGILAKVSGNRNVYVSVSSYDQHKENGQYRGYTVCSSQVSYDLDSSAKAEENTDCRWNHPSIKNGAGDRWVADRIRGDSEIQDAVLGDVCMNARELARESMADGIPVVGIFSGFGLHIHQLFQKATERVSEKLESISRKWISDLSLGTADPKASGQPFRIMRYPNVERIIHDAQRESTGIFTIPLSGSELADITPDELVELSCSPRVPDGLTPDSRPSMEVQSDYLGPGPDSELGQEAMRSMPDQEMGTEFIKALVKDVVKLPCVYKRALTRNPPNDVRVKFGIHFLNAGYSVSEITDIIREIGWKNFDRETTKYQLKSLKKSGKGDWSCRTLRSKGLCVCADEPRSCDTYGYQGGNSP